MPAAALRRIARRGLLLSGAVAAAWLLGALLQSASADARTVNPVNQTLDTVTSTARTLTTPLTATLDPARSLTGPILGPVESLLGRAPIGGVLTPPPVPIQGPPLTSLVSGVLPVLPAVAEPPDLPSASQSVVTASESAMSKTGALLPGSVPETLPDPLPPAVPPTGLNLLTLPAGPSAPPLLPIAAGGGPAGGAGTQNRPSTDSELPAPGALTSMLATRAPPAGDTGTARSLPDDPSVAPD